mgnify:CR=1 FL=1
MIVDEFIKNSKMLSLMANKKSHQSNFLISMEKNAK